MQQFDAHDYPTSGHQYQEPFRPNQHSFENIPQQNQFTSPINNQAMNYYGSGYRPNNPNPNSYSYQNTPFIRPIYRAPPTENAFNCNNEQRLRMNAPINPVPRGFLPQFPNQLHPPQHNSSQMNFGAPNMGSNRSIEPPIYRPEFQWNNVQNQEFNTKICGFSAENEECNSNTASFERESMTDISKSTLSKKRNLENDEWICNWIILVEKREDREKEERKKTSELKISDIQKKLLTYASLVSELDEVLREFSSCNESDHENWEILYKKAEDLKEEIRLLKDFFGDEKKVREIKEMLTKRRGRRGRVRKVKKEKARKRRRMKEEWKEKEKEIDHRLNQLHEEEKAKISEGKMKKEADAILREVTTKQEEAHRMRKLLEALTKLREARIKKGEMHGYVASPQASAFFAKLKGEFGKLLADQLDLYRAEEQTLRVMMEESKNTLSRSSFKRLNRTPKVEKIQKQIYEILFGEKILPEHQNEFQRSFTSADESIEILVKRRFDWDQFLVSEDTPSGSSVPIGWVVPNGDSNSDWKTFQQN